MTDNAEKKPSMELETVVGSGSSTSGDFGKTDTTVVTSATSQGAGVDFNGDGTVSRTGLGAEVEQDLKDLEEDEGDELQTDTEGAEGDDTGTEGTEGDGLEAEEGEPFDAEDPASIKAFDEKYLKPDGSGLNLQSFEAEVKANVEKGVWDVNKSTRSYLSSMGIDGPLIDNYMEGMKARAANNESAFLEVVGGKEAFDTKLAWGKANFTPAQKKRYNDAMAKGGEEAAEQLELLNTRYSQANPGAAAKSNTKRIGFKRPASPQRDATLNTSAKASGGSKVEPFANAEAHRVAMNEAATSNDPKKMEEVRSRLRASPWFKA